MKCAQDTKDTEGTHRLAGNHLLCGRRALWCHPNDLKRLSRRFRRKHGGHRGKANRSPLCSLCRGEFSHKDRHEMRACSRVRAEALSGVRTGVGVRGFRAAEGTRHRPRGAECRGSGPSTLSRTRWQPNVPFPVVFWVPLGRWKTVTRNVWGIRTTIGNVVDTPVAMRRRRDALSFAHQAASSSCTRGCTWCARRWRHTTRTWGHRVAGGSRARGMDGWVLSRSAVWRRAGPAGRTEWVRETATSTAIGRGVSLSKRRQTDRNTMAR